MAVAAPVIQHIPIDQEVNAIRHACLAKSKELQDAPYSRKEWLIKIGQVAGSCLILIGAIFILTQAIGEGVGILAVGLSLAAVATLASKLVNRDGKVKLYQSLSSDRSLLVNEKLVQFARQHGIAITCNNIPDVVVIGGYQNYVNKQMLKIKEGQCASFPPFRSLDMLI